MTRNITAENNSIDVDSGIHKLSIKSSTQSSLFSVQSNSYRTLNNIEQDGSCGDDESADSFVTCLGSINGDENNDEEVSTTVKSNIHSSASLNDFEKPKSQPTDLSDNNFFDANEEINQTIKNDKTKKKSKSFKFTKNNNKIKQNKTKQSSNTINVNRPIFSSIISDLFEGKLIGQVQCLECMNISTTTETFQNLSLPIPTKEYLQTMQYKIQTNSKNNYSQNENSKSSSSDNNGNSVGTTVPNQQGWISWMVDLMKGYLWNPTIKLQECLNAFFSEDELKGDNKYSCEKCKKYYSNLI
jgi:ubiquitin C-terminal hydrolase